MWSIWESAAGRRGPRVGVWRVGVALCIGLVWVTPLRAEDARPGAAQSLVPSEQAVGSLVERGEFLVRVTDCGACHTPMNPATGAPDLTRQMSGHPADIIMPPPPPPTAAHWTVFFSDTNTAYAGPWGVSYATNLTPDVETGIGGWGEQLFVDTMKSGMHLGGEGRPMLPPMPGEAYRHLPEEDLRAMYAYFMTLPAISNRVPEATPPQRTP